MTLLSWYEISGTPIWTWLGNIFTRSFHFITKFGWLPDAFYIASVCLLLVIWMGMMRKYDSQAKDKGLID